MTIKIDRRMVLSGLAAAVPTVAWGQPLENKVAGGVRGLPSAVPEREGMSSAGLAGINAVMADFIARNLIQGGVTAVARNGKVVHLQAHGYFDVGAKTPMPVDALFRMASSTKPVTAVALMQQIERGRVSLDDKIGKYIPELASMNVVKAGRSKPAARLGPAGAPAPVYAPEDIEPQAREITIRDLATHTSGLGWILPREPGGTLENQLRRYKDVALDFQPGTRWAYSPGTGPDVLARVVEIACGERYDQYLKAHIFDPIGMNDTRHNITPAQWDRLVHRAEMKDGAWQAIPDASGNRDVTYFDGSGGLRGTAADFLLFYTMLAHKGSINGRRVLRPESVDVMASDLAHGLYTRPGKGFGALVEVKVKPPEPESPLSPGSFGWNGAFGTHSFANPSKRLSATLMIQQPVTQLHRDFDAAVEKAIVA